MSKDEIQHQRGYSLYTLFKDYSSEDQCVEVISTVNGLTVLSVQHVRHIAIVH